MNNSPLYGGIEGGGTKFVCAIGDAEGKSLAETRFPTTTPEDTLSRALDFFRDQTRVFGPLAGLGVACFGPLDPNPASPTYGRILATPKAGWAGTDVVGALQSALPVPIAFDTDVNGARGRMALQRHRTCPPSCISRSAPVSRRDGGRKALTRINPP